MIKVMRVELLDYVGVVVVGPAEELSTIVEGLGDDVELMEFKLGVMQGYMIIPEVQSSVFVDELYERVLEIAKASGIEVETYENDSFLGA